MQVLWTPCNLENNLQSCVFILTQNKKHRYSTYLSFHRILTPNPNTNEPLYVVNIYHVSFYTLLHKELSVLWVYFRRDRPHSPWAEYLCVKPHHSYAEVFLLFISDILCGQSDMFLAFSSTKTMVMGTEKRRSYFVLVFSLFYLLV